MSSNYGQTVCIVPADEYLSSRGSNAEGISVERHTLLRANAKPMGIVVPHNQTRLSVVDKLFLKARRTVH